MMNDDLLTDDENRDAYDDLVVSIDAKANRLNLLIGVCDDASFRDEIIAQYEAELEPQIRCFRTTLARGEPSLRAAVAKLVESEEYLQQHNPAVISVTGAEQLHFLKLGEERSEQEIFFGYLQWTREGLREFYFAIVLWVTNQILVELIKKAPDFWSWRNGVFRFVSRRKNTVSARELEPIRFAFTSNELSGFDDENEYLLPIEDLQGFIQDLEQRGVKDTTLATLYFSLGDIYRKRLERSESLDYKKEQELGIKYLNKAVELQKELGLEKDLASSLNNLAFFYRSQGRYSEAEPLYIQALALRRKLLGEEHPDVATSLNNLAGLYCSQGRYSEAEPLYIQALALRRTLLGEEHPDVATSLNNLAGLYESQGRYSEAEPLYIQDLALSRKLLGEEHPDVATSLNNLAFLYKSQGRYSEAEPLYIQALALKRKLLGEEHPDVATSLNNLAGLYRSQGRYSEAEPLYIQALALRRTLLGEEHPSVATSLNNLALLYESQGRYSEAEPLYIQDLALSRKLLGEEHPDVASSINNLASLYRSQGRYSEAEPLYVQALALRRKLLGEEHPDVAQSLNNLASLYESQGRYSEAEPLYIQALDILEKRLGIDHPNTVTVRKNLVNLRDRLSSES
ncbi:tetratricopeptide repeat protein [Aulosira sp. FACHB-615]|uniref:tetratricopeptide repeat protein n=1 Tax=Aulosira sp. FACHB-615 TaxID=2692777 RepID=UPI001681ED90|nr:tetratricopeptide repeat protein [Aulosira sp. FACHB-615]MBD2486217.1 tetratricopeptide repeat protein [Aulosira sp. FACHB-615]